MATPDGGTDDFDASLFEGMVLFSPSDLSHSTPDEPRPPPPPPAASAPPIPPTSQPLDEDLFSDLTLQTLTPIPDPPPTTAPSPSRQISRKKKRAVRIGYGRDAASDDPDPLPLPPPAAEKLPEDSPPEDISADSPPVPAPQSPSPLPAPSPEREDSSSTPIENVTETGNTDAYSSIEENLRLAKVRSKENYQRIREKASSVLAERKELVRKRRRAVEELGLALARHRELEKELEEACEAEDFEKAEMASESLAAAEKEKDGLVSALRDAEVACDVVDSEMEKVLEMQIAAEEEEAAMLEQFAKDAANQADLILKDAEEIATKEMEEWQSSMELLEVKRLEMDIESQLIFEAQAGLNDSIEHMVEDERKEQENLTRKKDIVAKELDELLELVRLK